VAASTAQTGYPPRIDDPNFGRAQYHYAHLWNPRGVHDRLVVLIEDRRGEKEIRLLAAAAKTPLTRQTIALAGAATNVTRLTACWEKEYTAFRQRDLAGREYVYVWVDGVHFNIRLEDDRLCTLVMIGARANGEKELLAVEDGYRESAESWKTLLRDLKRRGMAAPVVAVGDGALGFWAAAREVWPATREQACWVHKLVNVLDKLPPRLQPRAKRALHEMMYAECRADCETARARFAAEYLPKYSKAVASLTANWERLVTFFDFPAEHWKHLRTTNVIESPFATVRLRERATRGAGSRTKGLLMAFKLLDMVQLRWRHLDGAQLLPLVRAGVKFADGVQVDPAKPVTQTTDNQPREAA
jgi:putative transposase